MVSLTPFILSSSTFSCTRSNSKNSAHSRIKSKLSSHIKRRNSYSIYHSNNTSSEHLLIPSDHILVGSLQSSPDESPPRRLSSSLGQHWYLLHLNHPKRMKTEEAIPSKESRDYYLLAATSRPSQVQSTNASPSPCPSKRNSIRMSSRYPSSSIGKPTKIFGESFEPVRGPTDGRNERRRSYGIGGAGNIRKPSEVIYTPRERRRSSVFSNPSVSSSGSCDKKRGGFLSWFGIGSSKKG